MIIAGTGHRPDKLGGYDYETFDRVTTLARDWLREVQPSQVISGMALGWDQALAQASADLDIPFIAAVPFKGFASRWPKSSQYQMTALLCAAAEIHVVSEIACVAALHERNEWMVDRADKMVALWDGSFGGTFNCLRYAEKVKRPVENLWPRWELRSLLS